MNAWALHSAAMAASFSSICSSLTALIVRSSTSSPWASRSDSKMWASRKTSSRRSRALPVIVCSCSQWRGRIALESSAWSRGTRARKSSMRFLQSW